MPSHIIWLDIAKGIAIILMVLGHTSIPMPVSNFIWSFHMPLFFVASGWCTNWEHHSFREYAVRKIRSLCIPFLIYSIIVFCVLSFLNRITIEDWLYNGWGSGYALWFIPVLFLAGVVCRLIYMIRSISIRYIILFLIFSLGVFLCSKKILLPWNLSSVPYAVFFISFGYEIRKLERYILHSNIIFFLVYFIPVLIISHFWKLDMCFNQIIPIIPITIGAVCGTFMVFTLSSWIEKKNEIVTKIISKVGKETYVILAFSQIIIILLNEYLNLNVFVKYIVLVSILIGIVYLKNTLNKLLNVNLL